MTMLCKCPGGEKSIKCKKWRINKQKTYKPVIECKKPKAYKIMSLQVTRWRTVGMFISFVKVSLYCIIKQEKSVMEVVLVNCFNRSSLVSKAQTSTLVREPTYPKRRRPVFTRSHRTLTPTPAQPLKTQWRVAKCPGRS